MPTGDTRGTARCTATAKSTGVRCTRYPMLGQKTCQVHGGATARARAAGRRELAKVEVTAIAKRAGLPPPTRPEDLGTTIGAYIATLNVQFVDVQLRLNELRAQTDAVEHVRAHADVVALQLAVSAAVARLATAAAALGLKAAPPDPQAIAAEFLDAIRRSRPGPAVVLCPTCGGTGEAP